VIGYGRQSIDDSDLAAVAAVLRGQPLTCGPAVEAFEGEIRRISGAPYAAAVSNGTSALRLLYQAAGIGPGQRVGVPAITFVATASQAMLLGAEVVLLDVDPQTLLLTPEILDACRERLDWVVAVHVAGRMCDLAGLAGVCRRKGIRLLEDAAHAFGSTRDGGECCGDCRHSEGAIFSFHPVKNVTTAEGGAIVVRDPAWDRRVRQLRHHGIVRDGFVGDLAAADAGSPWYHEFHQPATNERLSDLHCALGASQCRRIEAFKRRRAAIVDAYRADLAGTPWLAPAPAPGQQPFWHLAVAQVDWAALGTTRRAAFDVLAARGIAPQVHYIPLHHQPVLATASRASALAGADAAYRGMLSLPCYPDLDEADRRGVVEALRSLACDVRNGPAAETLP
jgi:dTDP-4-amino-4,6-dideoxygalactose transaminase